MSSRGKSGRGGGDNPFESRGNRGVHFSVLGRSVRGGQRNVAAARSAATARRHATIGVELASAGKVNAFVDKRFGEYDDSVDVETRALVRLQKERKRQLGVSSKRARFNLEADGAGAGKFDSLTHMGKSLSDADAFENMPRRPAYASDEEDGEGLNADLTAAHFGGGDAPAGVVRGARPVPAWAAEGGKEEHRRSYQEIMDEVMAKSKAARAEKAAEKAHQEFVLQRLDMQTDDITRLLSIAETEREQSGVSGGAAGMKLVSASASKPFAPAAPSARAPTAASTATLNSMLGPSAAMPEKDDYEALMLTLASQSRAARASDRTKTAEELAAEEADRLAEMEALRLQRMRGEGGDSLSSNTGAQSADYVGGDDLNPNQKSTLTYRQKRRVESGVSILQYGEAAAKAAAAAAAAASDEEDEESDEFSDDSSASSGSDEEEEEGDEEEEEEEEAEEEGEDEELDEFPAAVAEGSSDAEEEADMEAALKAEGADAAFTAAADATEDVLLVDIPQRAEDMPFMLPCPSTVEEWAGLVRKYCAPYARSSADAASGASAVAGKKRPRTEEAPVSQPSGFTDAQEATTELLRRIRACHAIALAATNRDALLRLYGVLMKHVHLLCDASGSMPAWLLEPVMRTLHAMSQEKPLAAGTAAQWKATLKAMHRRVSQTLARGHVGSVARIGTDAVLPAAAAAWLTPGEFVLLRFAQCIFPLTDYRHVVMSTLSALLCQCLQLIPIMNIVDVARGLLHASLLLDMTKPARRYAPEAVAFLSSTLALFAGLQPEPTALPNTSLALSAPPAPPAPTANAKLRTIPPRAPPLARLQPTFIPVSTGSASAASMSATDAAGAPARAVSVAVDTKARVGTLRIPFALLHASLSTASETDAPEAVQAACAQSALLPAACLASTLRMWTDLAEVLVPKAFMDCLPLPGAPGSAQYTYTELMTAAVAPAGDVARGLLGGASTSFASPLSVLPAPFACACDVLDPALNTIAVLLSVLPASTPTPAAKALRAELMHTVQACAPRRDAVARHRTPARLYETGGAPRSIKVFAPLLEEVGEVAFGGNRRVEDDADEAARMRAEIRGLQRQKKREQRGAARELRKDREFVVRELDKKAAVRAGERETNYKEVITFLQTQQATFNQMVRMGGSIQRKPKVSDKDAATVLNTGKTKADRTARKGFGPKARK